MSEWERTCGPAVKAFVIYCEQYDAIDKLIVKIALATEDRIIVSGESDFWDPKKPNNRQIPGQANAPVARFFREQLEITVLTLKMLLAKMR
jgi:hypothetical protein